MTELLLGGIGALIVVMAFVAGTVYGYKISAAAQVGVHMQKLTDATVEEITKQRQQMKEENDAFNNLMGYDVNTAYRLNEDPNVLLHREADA